MAAITRLPNLQGLTSGYERVKLLPRKFTLSTGRFLEHIHTQVGPIKIRTSIRVIIFHPSSVPARFSRALYSAWENEISTS
jgi:hypothetical protein